MKLKIQFLFLFIFLLSQVLAQDIQVRKKNLTLLDENITILDKFIWKFYSINKSDSIIILVSKGQKQSCINKNTLNIKKIYSVNNGTNKLRFYANDIYINDTLVFPKDKNIYLLDVFNDNRKSVSTEDHKNVEQDSLTNTQTKNSRPTIDLIHETENLKLYGDTTIEKDKISFASIKFEPYIGFDDFKVNSVDHKKYANLDLKSNKEASNFRTRLKEGYSSDTANFAGHYSFVYWGCGSNCQSSSLIDRKTGKIYDSPGASLGYDFRVDSKMLIVNPPDTGGFYDDCFYCKPIIYIFDEQTKTFNERQRK